MTELTPLAITLLALLCEHPMHPYEMHQTLLERRQDTVVKIRPGSLYHTVERLRSGELIAVDSIAREGNRPERTTYRILPAGRQALQRRVGGLLRARAAEFPSLPVALGEIHWLPKAQATADLRTRLRQLESELDLISADQNDARKRQVAPVVMLASSYLHHQLSAEHDWITRTIERIETEEYSWPSK